MIRPATPADEDAIVVLSLAAWTPVFASMHDVVGPALFRALFTDDWRRYQEDDVRKACRTFPVWVATADGSADGGGGQLVGFVAVNLPEGEPHGEIHMIAVDPAHQGQGTGGRLTEYAVEQMRAAGRSLAIVNTGGDPGHAPARATYERAGFVSLPAEQYFRLLEPPAGA